MNEHPLAVNPDLIKIEGILHAIEDAEYHISKEKHDKTVLQAITYNIMVIGEISKKLSVDLKKQYPHIKWRDIADMRNLLIHEYSKVSKDVIQDVMGSKLPELKRQVQEIFQKLENDS